MQNDIRVENGSWYFTGHGAMGFREYRMGKEDEETRNRFGYLTGYTVKEAHEAGLLYISENGQPICDKFK